MDRLLVALGHGRLWHSGSGNFCDYITGNRGVRNDVEICKIGRDDSVEMKKANIMSRYDHLKLLAKRLKSSNTAHVCY